MGLSGILAAFSVNFYRIYFISVQLLSTYKFDNVFFSVYAKANVPKSLMASMHTNSSSDNSSGKSNIVKRSISYQNTFNVHLQCTQGSHTSGVYKCINPFNEFFCKSHSLIKKFVRCQRVNRRVQKEKVLPSLLYYFRGRGGGSICVFHIYHHIPNSKLFRYFLY